MAIGFKRRRGRKQQAGELKQIGHAAAAQPYLKVQSLQPLGIVEKAFCKGLQTACSGRYTQRKVQALLLQVQHRACQSLCLNLRPFSVILLHIASQPEAYAVGLSCGDRLAQAVYPRTHGHALDTIDPADNAMAYVQLAQLEAPGWTIVFRRFECPVDLA